MATKSYMTVTSTPEFPTTKSVLERLGVGYYPIDAFVKSTDSGLMRYIKAKEAFEKKPEKTTVKPNSSLGNNQSSAPSQNGNVSEGDVNEKPQSFAELYKESAISDANSKYETTLALLNNYLSAAKKEAKSGYASALASLDGDLKQRERAEWIEYERLLKKLPEYLARQGLGSLGVSQSALISAKNDHMNTLGQLYSDYSAAKAKEFSSLSAKEANVLEDYNSKLLSAEKERDKSVSEIMNEYYSSKKKESDTVSAGAYSAALNALDPANRTYKSNDERKEYVLSLKPFMNETDWRRISLLIP